LKERNICLSADYFTALLVAKLRAKNGRMVDGEWERMRCYPNMKQDREL
jgi:hypothetical protein